MSSKNSIEMEGRSVEQAIRAALAEIGAEEDDVSIEILSTPRSGLLGLGSRPARVRVTRRTPEAARSEVASPPPQARSASVPPIPAAQPVAQPVSVQSEPATTPASFQEEPEAESRQPESERGSADLDAQGREALNLVQHLLELMGEPSECAITSNTADGIDIDIKGDGSGILIGRHGQTLDSFEYLINRLLARRIKDAAAVVVDVSSYRARRRQQLERMALSMGERAKRERKPVTLEPMPPRDRRVVHLALKDDPFLATRSLGNGYMRSLEILPADLPAEQNERATARRRASRDTPGQQGGFRRGQKRLV